MKEAIHPKFYDSSIRCSCGETFATKSTKEGEILVEICSKCHPFFTGKQKFVVNDGRAARFKKRCAAAAK
ncbi:MAG: 50S ribosomal protein L31 [Clostridiales bacterium]|nr:50S ribosomal protein L31 [Clostridiales bacterium]